MFDKTDRRMYMAQQNYKENYDKSIRKQVQYKVGDYVFIDRPRNQQRTVQERNESINISKLRPQVIGPYLIKQVFDAVLVVMTMVLWSLSHVIDVAQRQDLHRHHQTPTPTILRLISKQ